MGTTPFLTRRSRELRKRSTPEEEMLWHALRARRLGYKIRRQHPLGNAIVDFYCVEARLAIELDGDCHNDFFDELRDTALVGVKVLRFPNAAVNANVFDVVATIKRELDLRRRSERPFCPLSTEGFDGVERGSGGEAQPPSRPSTTLR